MDKRPVVGWTLVLSSFAAVAFAVWVGLPSTPRGVVGSMIVAGSGVTWATTGGVLVSLRPRNVLSWLIIVIGASLTWSVGLMAYSALGREVAWPATLAAATIAEVAWLLGHLLPGTVLVAFYPDGKLPSAWWRLPVVAVWAGLILLGILSATQGPDGLLGRVVLIVLPAATFAIWVGTIVRIARARPPQRQQLAWLACVVIVGGLILALMDVLGVSASWATGEGNLPRAQAIYTLIAGLTLVLTPVAVAIGVLRYRLLGIETVLRRGLVYGSLTVLVFGTYLGVSVVLDRVMEGGPVPGLVGAAVVAVVLAPAREWLQRAADRFVYGDRADPFRAVSRMAQRVASASELNLLPEALTAVCEAVRAPAAAVVVPNRKVIAEIGVQLARPVTVVPLPFGGGVIGELQIGGPREDECYTDAERRILSALAPQLAVVVRALELSAALKAERDRVVSAARGERDRLRRDLHDGLGPSLTGMGLGLQALADTLVGPPQAAVLLDRIRAEVVTAVAEVRRIIDDLRPAMLDTADLTDAIRRHAETVSTALPVAIEAAPLPVVPPAVETAAYRIATEALTNVARHANARHARLELTTTKNSLQIIISDDGCGIDRPDEGVGLDSMRRRAEALGGRLDVTSSAAGTTITALLPLESP
jgi:signal transduction histidine kinase